MNKKLAIKIVAYILFIIMALLGGRVKNNVIDDIKMATAIGFDWVDKDHIKATVVSPIFNPDKTVEDDKYSNVSILSQINRQKLNATSSKPLLNGKLLIALMDETLAKHGVMKRIDTLYRDPHIGERIYLAIVEGSANELLTQNYEHNMDIGDYLAKIVKHESEQGTMPTTNLHEFSSLYYTKGSDPYLPVLKKYKNKVTIKGIAYLKNDKYVGYIPYQDTFIFKALREPSQSGTFTATARKSDRNNYFAMDNITSKRKYAVRYVNGIPNITVTVNIKGNLTEAYDPTKMFTMDTIEKLMKKEFEGKASKLIKMLQEKESDPLGFGYQVRIRTYHWNYDKWKLEYPNVPIKVVAHVNIVESGVTE